MTITETEITITAVMEIGSPSDFPEPDSLEGFNEIMEEIFTEGKIQEVVACIKDLGKAGTLEKLFFHHR